MSFWINLHKPMGMTSNDAVSAIKKLLQIKKVGHAGTLDPLACGVLPIAVGEATKSVQYVQSDEKEYIFTISFGESTTTDDREGDVIFTSEHIPSEEDIAAILPEFTGQIMQTPPIFSALKVNGKRAYDMARNNIEVKMQPRPVDIFSLELLKVKENNATLRVRCGKGTYVRSLGRDIAEKLGSCGHISYLERTMVGKFSKKNVISLDFIKNNANNTESFAMQIVEVLDDIPVLQLSDKQYDKVKNGIPLIANDMNDGFYRAMFANNLQAILNVADGFAKVKRGFNLT